MRFLFALLLISLEINVFSQINLGVNLSDLANTGTQWMLNDAMKQSSGWFVRQTGTQDFGTHLTNQIPTDTNGYPVKIPYNINGTNHEVHALMLNNQPSPWRYPSGDYTLIFEGTGQVRVDWDVNSAPEVFTNGGTYTVTVNTPSNLGLNITILQSDTNDRIRNIRFILPGYSNNYQTQPFTNEFLNFINDFKTLRFMKPLSVEENPIVSWNQRTKPSYYTYYTDLENTIRPQLPYELMVQLANDYNKDIWLTVPYMANDKFVINLAAMLYNSLDSDVNIYLEYSNETWNNDYPNTYNYMVSQGLANNLGTTDPERNAYYYTYRSIQIFEKFDSVFANQTNRIRTVLATQGYDVVAGRVATAYQSAQMNPNSYVADYFSIAPYFGAEIISSIEAKENICNWTAQRFIDSVQTSLIPNLNEIIRPIKVVANQINLPIVAYEGGHGIGMFRQLNTCAAALADSANRDSKMRDIYCTFFKYWTDSVGSGVMNSFVSAESAGSYGAYGIVESIFQTFSESPKWTAHNDLCVITSQKKLIVDKDIPTYIGNNTWQYKKTQSNIVIYNITGQRIYHEQKNNEINLSSLNSGIYFIKADENAIKVFKK